MKLNLVIHSHEIEPSNTSNIQENIKKNDIERGEMLLYKNQEISPEKILLKVP